MSVDTGPPAQPPQLSPDGKWVWDGTRWQPIAAEAGDPEPAAHASVFAAYSKATAGVGEPGVDAPVFTENQARPMSPAVDYSNSASEPIVPLWQQPSGSGVSRYLYFGAAIVLFVMVMIVLNSMSIVQLPFVSARQPSPTPAAAPSPTPDTSGPESVRADRFLNSTLAPASLNVEKTLSALSLHCYKTMSVSCFDAVSATEQQVKNLVAAVQNGDVPKCIALPMKKVLGDMKEMDNQLRIAMAGFNDNNSDALFTGVYRFWEYHQLTATDLSVVSQVKKMDCAAVELPSWVPD